MVATAVWEKIKNINFDLICGVPYTALPVATAISLLNQKPMIMRRKEAKDYGTKKIIEGVFSPEQTCLIVEDIITSGTSIIETIVPLENEGLKIKDAVVLIDREQGGKKHLQEKGYNIHCIFTISEILEILRQAKKIDLQSIETVQKFISQNQT
jgi:uridine monophosphate synthetase